MYLAKPLMSHRIHEESTTSAIIADNTRTLEDDEVYRKFWPDFIAKFLTKQYQKSEKSVYSHGVLCDKVTVRLNDIVYY